MRRWWLPRVACLLAPRPLLPPPGAEFRQALVLREERGEFGIAVGEFVARGPAAGGGGFQIRRDRRLALGVVLLGVVFLAIGRQWDRHAVSLSAGAASRALSRLTPR